MASRPSAQTTLPGFDVNPEPKDRLFFAIFPEVPAAEHIEALSHQVREQHGLAGKSVSADRLHVTLHHLGDFLGVPPDIEAMAREAAATVNAAPFRVSFDHVMSFTGAPGKRLLILHSREDQAALMDFQATLALAMRRAGLKFAKPGFTPHVTLSYEQHPIDERAVEPVSWTVREFRLTHSLLGAGRHTTLGAWQLQG